LDVLHEVVAPDVVSPLIEEMKLLSLLRTPPGGREVLELDGEVGSEVWTREL
jgi:hypothetical protein